jgi:hypothetical protein
MRNLHDSDSGISKKADRADEEIALRNEVGIEDRDEIKEDEHPIVVVAAADVVDLLRRNGKGSAAIVAAWLAEEFPKAT